MTEAARSHAHVLVAAGLDAEFGRASEGGFKGSCSATAMAAPPALPAAF